MARVWTGLLVGLVCSGVAGIVNQVVWQRALKIFLGGSETLSSMVVVLVFLLGLGSGAALAGRVTPRIRNPLLALAGVELALAAGNAVVAWILGLDLTESVYAVQRLALSAGVPLRVVYAAASAVLLLPPTMAMGATVPLASEACQRQLHAASARLVPVLFFVNTAGAAVGAWAASAWLLPAVGQRAALLVAVGCNALAALAVGLLARSPDAAPVPVAASEAPRPLTREEGLGALLGFLSLGYEMVLFRILALAHEPLPTTFATGLAGFLLAWSIGVALAGPFKVWIPVPALATAAAIAAVPRFYAWEVGGGGFDVVASTAIYVLPCIGFGWMYGQLVARGAEVWGRDVGRYTALNTLGSCAGILFFTLVGYEIPQSLDAWALAVLLVAAALYDGGTRLGAGVAGAVAVGLVGYGLALPHTETNGIREYWGRDGVVEVDVEGNVYIDGLWHTRLSEATDPVGRPYTWLMAFAAALAHDDPHPKKALVVGAGVGVSSNSLAGLEGLAIDGYEINHTLKRVLRDYPEETHHVLANPIMRWMWQDARTGLALDATTYDIILSAPLYLRQAGSSLLLSKEYLALAKSRLAPGGVLAVYSNEDAAAQSRLVQRTIAEVFDYRVTWYEGLVTIASDHPIAITEERFRERLALPDRLYQQAVGFDRSLSAEGGLRVWYDGDRFATELADRPITDDQPLVEYPELAERWVGSVAP